MCHPNKGEVNWFTEQRPIVVNKCPFRPHNYNIYIPQHCHCEQKISWSSLLEYNKNLKPRVHNNLKGIDQILTVTKGEFNKHLKYTEDHDQLLLFTHFYATVYCSIA